MRLDGKYVVVTGASSGIGRALVPFLLKEGAFVLAVSRHIEKVMDITHARLWVKNVDVSGKANIDALFEHALECLGQVDVFIANAGFAYYEPLEAMDYEKADQILSTNLQSVVYSAKKMKDLNQDRPFNFMVTSSAIARLPMPGYALYGATKAAVDNFIRSANIEQTRKDQVFQTVFPVATDTKFFDNANADKKPWPVQSAEKVARKMVRGIKRDKKEVHPFALFKWMNRLCPLGFKPYIAQQKNIFLRHGKDKHD